MNNHIEMQPIRADVNSSATSSNPKLRTFKGKKLNKYLPNSGFFKKQPPILTQHQTIDHQGIHKSLKSMSLDIVPPSKKEENLTHVAYIPTTHNSVVLTASLPRSTIFTATEYAQLPMKEVKLKIAKTLLNIPDTPITLEQQARKGVEIYNYHQIGGTSKQPPSQSTVENTLPAKIELKTWENSLIYVKKYFSNLASEIYSLNYKSGGAMCIESNISLLTPHEIYELKKNSDMKAILEATSINQKYTFNICVNSVMPDLTESVYLNFFNIPEKDLEYIRNNPEITSLNLNKNING